MNFGNNTDQQERQQHERRGVIGEVEMEEKKVKKNVQIPSSITLQQKEDKFSKKSNVKNTKNDTPNNSTSSSGSNNFRILEDGSSPMTPLPQPKHKRNPLVFLGAITTAGVLGVGLISFYKVNSRHEILCVFDAESFFSTLTWSCSHTQ